MYICIYRLTCLGLGKVKGQPSVNVSILKLFILIVEKLVYGFVVDYSGYSMKVLNYTTIADSPNIITKI